MESHLQFRWHREPANNEDINCQVVQHSSCVLIHSYFKTWLIFLSCCSCSALTFLPQRCLPSSDVSQPDFSSTSGTSPWYWCPAVQMSLAAFLDKCVAVCVKDEGCVRAPAYAGVSTAGVCVCAVWRVIVLSLRFCMTAMHQRPCQWCPLMGFRFNFYIIM